jgi:hypothetical protein
MYKIVVRICVSKILLRNFIGFTIRNTENVMDNPEGLRCRRRSQIQSDVICSVLSKIVQSNAWFVITALMNVRIDCVNLTAECGGVGLKSKI